jgi:Protein of unknown function (DUF4238)
MRDEVDKHHYLPVYYLKSWTGADGRLCEFSRPYALKPGQVMPAKVSVKPRRTHPDGTGYIRGLNTFRSLPAPLADFLENRFLKRSDDFASRALTHLLGDDVNLDVEIKSGWSRFILTLLHRTPEAMDRLTTQIVDYYPLYIEELRRAVNAGDADVIEVYREALSDERLERLKLQLLQMNMDSEYLGTALNRMLWAVIRFDETHHLLLTSDRPIVMTNGLGHADSHLVMPVSPLQIFIAANNQETVKNLHEMAESGGMAQRLNNRMARQARRYVYGVDDSMLHFIEPRLGQKARWSPLE